MLSSRSLYSWIKNPSIVPRGRTQHVARGRVDRLEKPSSRPLTLTFNKKYLINKRSYVAVDKVASMVAFAKDVGNKLLHNSFILDPHIEKLNESRMNASYKNSLSQQNVSPTDQLTPWKLIEGDLEKMNDNIRKILATSHPTLETIAVYYFNLKGKRIRPVVVALMSAALTAHNQNTTKGAISLTEGFVSQKQRELAEIVEMIHTATLIHDDVVDSATLRRNMPSANVAFGNKMAVLCGDFLLARSSVALAGLGNLEVTRLMSSVLAELVEGEFMQIKNSKENALDFDYYMSKTYNKTASLIANGCRGAAELGHHSRELVDIAGEYGKHLGLAFQLIDDLLDYIGTEAILGKPAAADLKLGLTTAPALFAKEEFPELTELIARKFSEEGDVEKARLLVSKSKGIEKTKELATKHVKLAVEAISKLNDSPFRQGLIDLTEVVLRRDK